MPEKITCLDRRASIEVLCWGNPPFAKIDRGYGKGEAYIPNGFKAEKKTLDRKWFAETRVLTNGKPEYRFSCKDDSSLDSGWVKSQTNAFSLAAGSLEEYQEKSNGTVVFGIVHEPAQRRLIEIFGLEQMEASSVTSHPSPTKKRPAKGADFDAVAAKIARRSPDDGSFLNQLHHAFDEDPIFAIVEDEDEAILAEQMNNLIDGPILDIFDA